MKSSTAFRPFLACVLALLPYVVTQAADESALRGDRPDRYTVQKGDTLWGISGRFLKEPWRWPELWRMNRDQIRNPHLIYPGNVLVLDKIGDDYRLRMAGDQETLRVSPQVRVSELDRAPVPSIPAQDIEPWLTRSLVVSEEFFAKAAKIVSARAQKLMLTKGDAVYAFGVDRKSGDQWSIYRRGQPLRAIGAREVLGYEAVFVGTARLDRHADVSRMIIDGVEQEIAVGDFLVPTPAKSVFAYVPRAPERDVYGHVIALPQGVGGVGKPGFVTIDLGADSDIEVGHVLAVFRRGGQMRDPRDFDDPLIFDSKVDQTQYLPLPERYVAFPDDRIGLVFVFRVFDRVAYGFVVDAELPLEVGDIVRTPGTTF